MIVPRSPGRVTAYWATNSGALSNIEVRVVGALINQPVDQIGIAVIGEDHRPIAGEDVSKNSSEIPCGCCWGLQLNQVDDIDYPNAQMWQDLAQMIDGGKRLERRHVAGTGHDDVGVHPRLCNGLPPRPWSAIAASPACRPMTFQVLRCPSFSRQLATVCGYRERRGGNKEHQNLRGLGLDPPMLN